MYKARKVYETLGFQRGQSSKAALNIGLRTKIASWLDGMQVRNYTINDDLTIDVDGDVNLALSLHGNLPSFIKFGKVGGYFSCRRNNSTSLRGAPRSVGVGFSCDDNNLTSLEGAPQSVRGSFFCMNNKVQFTEEDVRKVSNVEWSIYV